jgi:hypothetical protein
LFDSDRRAAELSTGNAGLDVGKIGVFTVGSLSQQVAAGAKLMRPPKLIGKVTTAVLDDTFATVIQIA